MNRAAVFVSRAVTPRLRLIAGVGFALVVVGLTHILALVTALLLAALTTVAGRVAPGVVLRRLAALDGVMLFVPLLLPFSVPGDAVFTIAGCPASYQGVLRAVEILLKANAVLLMTLALLGSLEAVEVGHAMIQLRFPEKFVCLFLFTIRYIDVLGGEYRRLRVAMKTRGFVMRCDLHTWQSIGYLFGMLMVRSLERSERIVAAMRCRGFQGRFHALIGPETAGRHDHGFAAASLAVCLVLVTLERA